MSRPTLRDMTQKNTQPPDDDATPEPVTVDPPAGQPVTVDPAPAEGDADDTDDDDGTAVTVTPPA